MERRHDRPSDALLDLRGLGVHRYVEKTIAGAQEGQGDREQGYAGARDGQGEREAERDTSGRRHHATTEPADEPARHRERDHRAGRHGQEDEPELTVAHHVTALDCWDVGDPTGERGAVDEEEDGNRRARPARCHPAVGNVSHEHRFVPIA